MKVEELYNQLVYLALFLGGLWYSGYLCKQIKLSPIVGHILFGIVFGPQGVDFIPDFVIEDSETGNENNGTAVMEVEDFLVLMGDIGVTFLIFESGLNVNFETLQKVGIGGFFVALFGTINSISIAVLVSYLVGFDAYPEGLAIGAVVGPTSVGIALKLLMDAHVLDSTFGQTIVTAAFTDDIFSLVTLTVLLSLASGSLSVWLILAPFVYCGLFIGSVFFSSYYLVPKVLPDFLRSIAERFGFIQRDIFHLTLMFLLIMAFGFIGDKIGSHLLGAFLAGAFFAKVPRTNHLWETQMSEINDWLTMLFFGATVAFAVPVDELLSKDAFWKGALMGIFAGVFGKIFAALHLRQKWIIGWAMVGRGEFSFFVGEIYKKTDFQDTGKPFLSAEGYAVAVWGLLIAIFLSPIGFGLILHTQLEKEKNIAHEELQNRVILPKFRHILFSKHRERMKRSVWSLRILCAYHPGLLSQVVQILEREGVFITQYEFSGTVKESDLKLRINVAGASEKTQMLPSIEERKNPDIRKQQYVTKDDYFRFDLEKFFHRLEVNIKRGIHEDASVEFSPAEQDEDDEVP